MNKKFSTLLAGVALMMGTVSANAQYDWWTSSLPDTLSTSTLDKFGKDEVKGAYFIGTANSDSVLYLNEMDTLKLVPRPIGFNQASLDSLSRSLWCASVIVDPEDGSNQRWEFVNRATETPLDVPMYDEIGSTTAPGYVAVATDSTKIGGALGGWAFHKSPSVALDAAGAPIYTYCDNNYVVALTGKGDGSKGVYLYKMLASEISDPAKTGAVTKFTLKSAQEIILTAAQINNKFGLLKNTTTGIKLDFDPNVKGEDIVNPFDEKNFCVETPTFLSTSTPGDSSRYVYVKREVSTGNFEYLKIDTAYANTTGAGKFLKFNWTDLSDAKRKAGQSAQDSLNASALKAQYMFLFTYMPSVDSLRIYVKQATFKTEAGIEHNSYFGGSTLTGTFVNDTVHRQNVYVNLQDLVKGQDLQILTVDSLKHTFTHRARAKVDMNTHIKFGWPSCSAVGQDLENIADGVYVIMNEDGEALGAPIEKNGTEFRWVKMDKKDAQHMPAYQWVVLKSRKGSDASAISITNREFEETKANSVQVYKDGTAKGFILRGGLVSGTIPVEAESFEFEPVEEKHIKNAHLGYGYYTEGEVSTLQYNFNYMHKFNMTTFIGKSDKAGDSVLYVNDEAHKGIFNLKFGKEKDYGYNPSKEVREERIPGLVRLKRATYVVYMGTDTLVANAKDYYSVGDVALADSFYFKENNCIDGKHYYAIIKSYNEEIQNNAQKVGIADDEFDNGLKVQVLGETRTSGFNIAVDNTPLYRTFNREILGENKDNSTDHLVFRDWVRGDEYLADEHNEKWLKYPLDYAGIWRKDVAGSKVAFRVDTARLNCDEGSRIKPQYLLSVANVVVDAVACDAHNASHTDWEGKPANEWTCSHATRGYVYGKYLVSFQDSVDAYGKSKEEALPYLDVKNGYTRVGFEPAIVTGDSLIFLLGKYKDMDPEELNVNEILESYNKTYTKKELADHIICKLGKSMSNAHHRYTWSFRYVEPEIALKSDKEGDNNRFLIESNGIDKNIAPEKGAWLKQQNGCLLLTDEDDSSFDNAKTGGDGALVFNAFQKEDLEADMATDNEEIATSEIAVIAQEGAIRIANAAGKKVVVTNVLGQIVANTILASDNAVIAAPQGVVVVAVEGEEAVKAIVK